MGTGRCTVDSAAATDVEVVAGVGMWWENVNSAGGAGGVVMEEEREGDKG